MAEAPIICLWGVKPDGTEVWVTLSQAWRMWLDWMHWCRKRELRRSPGVKLTGRVLVEDAGTVSLSDEVS